MAVPYRVLCFDLVGMSMREELPISKLKYSKVLNAPGAMSGGISLDDPKCTRANLDPGATAIFIERGKLLVWGGILWTARVDTVGRNLVLGAEGFWSYFRRMLIRSTQTFAAQDQMLIARTLVSYALAKPGALAPVVVGAETCGVLRDRTYYGYERKNLGEAVQQLAAVLNGFDFAVEVAWDSAGTTPIITFKLFYPRRGSRIDGLVFNHNVAGTGQFGVEVDATQASNSIDAIGGGDGDAMLIASASNTSVLARYPLYEDTVSYKDVVVPATLQGYATANVGRYAFPPEVPSLTKDAISVPDYGSFQEGDEGLVKAGDGWINYNGFQRIQSYEMSVDEEGTESMKIDFVSADASIN